MNDRRFVRTEMLLGQEGMVRLAASSVAVFGIGGVGSYAAEAMARAGIGRMTLVDHDTIDVTNINRQIHAHTETVGKPKTTVMAERIQQINPSCTVRELRTFYLPENADDFFPEPYDYVLDAVDTVTAKIDLAVQCRMRGIPMIACMGAANKIDPSLFEVMDIYQTKGDPLARILRKKLKERGIPKLKVTVLGCGRWGSFHAWYAHRVGHEVTLWGRADSRHLAQLRETRTNEFLTLPVEIRLSDDLAEAIRMAEIVIISIHAQALRSFLCDLQASGLGEKLAQRCMILCMKGLELGTGKRLTPVVHEEW